MSENNEFKQWQVFIQAKNGAPYEHAGSVMASDKKMALQNARDVYTRRNEGRAIWVVLSENIFSSNSEEEAIFFDPFEDKIYRKPTFFRMPEGTKNL